MRRHPLGLAILGFLLLELAWAAVLPLFRGPDELNHVYRSSAVASGQWEASGEHRPTRVQQDLFAAAADTCEEVYAELLPEVCRTRTTYEDGTVGTTSTAGSYNPAWYAVAGSPARILDGKAAALAMRLAGALLTAALLGWAWVLASTARTNLPRIALLVACTPAVLFAGAVHAPNGAQFAAGFLLWSAILAGTRGSTGSRTALLAGSVAAVTLVVTHTLGVVWLASILVSALPLITERARVRAWPSRATLLAAASVLGACVLSAAWVLANDTNSPTGGEPLADETREIGLVPNLVLWLLQTIGTMPYRFGLLWPWVYALWLLALVILLAQGLRRSEARIRGSAALATALSLAIPAVLTLLTLAELGYAWQGRYSLPLLIGVLLLAAEGAERSGASLPRATVPLVLLLVVLAQALALLCLGLREQAGPVDDGRPWALSLYVLAPAFLLLGYLAVLAAGRRIGPTS